MSQKQQDSGPNTQIKEPLILDNSSSEESIDNTLNTLKIRDNSRFDSGYCDGSSRRQSTKQPHSGKRATT